MVRFNRKGQQAYDNQKWLIKIIKIHAQILRESLEGYYILRVVPQSLLALDTITIYVKISSINISFVMENHQFS